MEYTVQKLSKMAGISTRTIRYYDEVGILKPARINSSGYRIYGQEQVDTLQQILFYRELGVKLEKIKEIISEPSFDTLYALEEHRNKLLEKRKQIDTLINNINKTIASSKGEIRLADKEKFEGFKKNIIDENEKKYGKEIREKYGNDTVDKSNKKMMGMSQEQYDEFTRLGEEVIEVTLKAFETGDPSCELAQRGADLHKQWLSYTWPSYSKEAHAGLAQMYVDDERFTAFYDKYKAGLAVFLRDAILIYTGINN